MRERQKGVSSRRRASTQGPPKYHIRLNDERTTLCLNCADKEPPNPHVQVQKAPVELASEDR